MPSLDNTRIAVIGLGYVGLPLAVAFGHRFPTLGFDIKVERVAQLQRGEDVTRELSAADLKAANNLTLSSNLDDLRQAQIYIVAVPTPIDAFHQPDLRPLISASRTVGQVIKKGDIVVYESTVYPGATEDDCLPVIEQVSGLRFNRDFFAGYSPERINPGDREHTLSKIVKVVSGSTPDVAKLLAQVYGAVVQAGIHVASSIRVAEAAKVIENTQRDLNIALINELALIFDRLGIDTQEVLAAAGTKWNFLNFKPGLVGGHCIGVDPYYLTRKAQEVGYHPEVILAGRRINDQMGTYVAERVIKLMMRKRIHVVGSRILILGFAFKENCPDVRNTRVIDVKKELESYHANVEVYDPQIDPDETEHEYGFRPIARLPNKPVYDAIILAVAHSEFRALGASELRKIGNTDSVLFDVKQLFQRDEVDGRL